MSFSHHSRALIFTGGRLGEWALSHVSPDDFLIGADRGAQFLISSGYAPHLALGDFDSVTSDEMLQITDTALELITFDSYDKDCTDTELAFREAVQRGFRHIVILGALGTRFDHSLGNVHLLRQADDRGCELVLADAHNEIRLCTGRLRLEANSRYPYVSLLPLSAEAAGVTLEGFRYPLREATLKLGWSLGISNVLESPVGTVSVSSGMLLVIQSRD